MLNLSKFIVPILSAIGVILTLITILDFDDEICISCWPVDYVLYFTYLLFGLGLIVALFGAVVGILSKPSSLKGSLIGIAAILAVFIISYVMADGEIIKGYPETTTDISSKWSGTGLYMFYILFVGAVGSIVVTSIMGLIKK
jgi:hypothetical protein